MTTASRHRRSNLLTERTGLSLLYSMSQTPWNFLTFSPNGWEFLVQILHAYYTFLPTLEYKFLLAHSKNELMQWRGVRRLSICLSVNFCANRFFSQTNGRIATKLAHDGLQVSAAQGQVKVKGHVIHALSWILRMSYSVIDGLVQLAATLTKLCHIKRDHHNVLKMSTIDRNARWVVALKMA